MAEQGRLLGNFKQQRILDRNGTALLAADHRRRCGAIEKQHRTGRIGMEVDQPGCQILPGARLTGNQHMVALTSQLCKPRVKGSHIGRMGKGPNSAALPAMTLVSGIAVLRSPLMTLAQLPS